MLKTELLIKRKIKIYDGDLFSPTKTFNCGQCFRFEENDGFIEGVVSKSVIRVPTEDTLGEIIYYSDKDFDFFFDPSHSYFEMSDYFLSGFDNREREALEEAIQRGFGIRILKQDFKEALISFIISQNNNIPRIKKNIAEISRKFGESFQFEGNTYYSFPTPEALLYAGEKGLNECKLGFRTKYILDASEKLKDGEVDEDQIKSLPLTEARELLKTIKGVGDKVAACTLLYGLGRLECVPVDVWVKRIFEKYFSAFPDLKEYGGVAQQYLFYNERYIKEGKK